MYGRNYILLRNRMIAVLIECSIEILPVHSTTTRGYVLVRVRVLYYGT